MRKHRGKALLGLLVTVVLLWWTLRDVSFAEVMVHLRGADVWWLAAMVAVATLLFVPRAMRWHVLLLPAHPNTSFRSRFEAVCVGFMANNLLPARLGEFARAFSLSRIEPVGMSAAFGSLVVERVFDGLVLAAFLALSLASPGSPVADGGVGAARVRHLAVGAALLFGLAAVALWLLVRFPDRALRFYEHTLGRILSPDLTDRGADILAAFTEGLGALHRPSIFLRTLAWTVGVWLVAAASLWCGFRAFDIQAVGFGGAVFLQAVIGFAVALPSSPGFFGPFEFAVRLVLGFYGVATARIVSFAFAYHILTFLPVTVMGLWFVHTIGLRWAEVERSEEIVGSAVEEERGDLGEAASGTGSGAAVPSDEEGLRGEAP